MSNTHQSQEQPGAPDDLTDRLHRLAAGVLPPPADPAADLRRGRRRLVWRRSAGAGAALLTAGVIGGVALAGHGQPGAARDGGSAGYADSSPSASAGTATPSPTRPASQDATQDATQAATQDATVPATQSTDPYPDGSGGFDAAATETLKTYNAVLAEHLDPQRHHLPPFSEKTRNEQSSMGGGLINGYGSKFGWAVEGSNGLGMLEIYVSRNWGGIESFSEATGPWRDAEVAGATRAQVATGSDGVVQVRAERPDGLTVALVADPLFGNNSTVAVPEMGLTGQQLLEAAVDPRLTLPPASS